MHIPYELIIIFVYLSGRLFFYDLNNILGSFKNRGYIKRLFWGFTVLLFTANLLSFVILFAFHSALVIFDSFIYTRKRDKSLVYIFHLFAGLVIVPLVVSKINPGIINIFNPLYILMNLIYESLPAIKSIHLHAKNIFLFSVLTGFIFTIKEGTIIIRLVLAKMRAVPKKREHRDNRIKMNMIVASLLGF